MLAGAPAFCKTSKRGNYFTVDFSLERFAYCSYLYTSTGTVIDGLPSMLRMASVTVCPSAKVWRKAHRSAGTRELPPCSQLRAWCGPEPKQDARESQLFSVQEVEVRRNQGGYRLQNQALTRASTGRRALRDSALDIVSSLLPALGPSHHLVEHVFSLRQVTSQRSVLDVVASGQGPSVGCMSQKRGAVSQRNRLYDPSQHSVLCDGKGDSEAPGDDGLLA
jgi:hypothetical protein